MKNRFQQTGKATLLGAVVAMSVASAFGLDQPVLFDTSANGVDKPIKWGLDTAWLSGDNMHRGSIYMGSNNVDIVRFSFTGDWPVTNGAPLAAGAQAEFDERMSYVNAYGNPSTVLYLNNDTANTTTNPYLVTPNSDGVDPAKWADLIDVTLSNCVAAGRTVAAVAPFNEPDNGTWQGGTWWTSVTTLRDVITDLRTTYAADFAGVNMYGGATLNDDNADYWYQNGWQLEEGCTHQLAGSFDNYAAFYTNVVAHGGIGVNDELHNVMEAMVGVEYGMSVGIWWGTAERARGEFVKASHGKRLAYAENRPNWTAASVYRAPSGNVEAFVGESERQALPTTYRFFSKDRPVYYDGHGPQRAYEVTTTGGSGYQTAAHHNAERVVNITWGADVQPAIDGDYYLVAKHSTKLMTLASASTNNNINIQQSTYVSGALTQQWHVNPLPATSGGDYSYYTIKSAYSDSAAEVSRDWEAPWQWGYGDGTNVRQKNFSYEPQQEWYLEYAGDGYFYIRNRWCGKCLDVSGNSTADGANIQQWSYTGNDNQKWRLVPVGANPTDVTVPPQLTGLTATANATSVQLKWNASTASDLDGYIVYRSYLYGSGYEIIARGITTNAFTDYSANQQTNYYYTVKAIDKSLNRSTVGATKVSAIPTGAPDLVAHYSFEGDSNDSSINGNAGEARGTVSYVPGGIGTNCLKLAGAGYVDLPAEMINHDQLTIAAWVNWNGGNAWQRIFDFGNGESQYLFLSPSDGNGQMNFGITTNNYWNEETLTAPALPSNQWVHVAVTLSNNLAKIYVNGINVATKSDVTLKPSDFNPVLNYIGRSQFASDPLFKGAIDDFRVYNYALSAADVYHLTDVSVANISSATDAISFNVENYCTIPTSSSDFAGAYNAANWNDGWGTYGLAKGGYNGATASNLIDDSAGATTLDATFATGDTWDLYGGYGPDPGADSDGKHNRRLLDGYLNSNAGTSITLSQIPYAKFDVYVYFNSDDDTRVGSVTDGTTTYYFGADPTSVTASNPAVLHRATATTTAGYAADANYAVFSYNPGVAGTSVMISTAFLASDKTSASYGGIAGFQVVNTVDTFPLPSQPTGLSAVSSDGQIDLSWSAATNAASYTVKYSLTNGGPYAVVDNPVTTNYLHTGLSNGTTYYYVVSALGNGGKSADSTQISAVPSVAVASNEFYFADHSIDGGTNLSLTVSNSVLGHDYGILATDTLIPPAWTNIIVQAGNGSNLLFGIPITGIESNRFFKLDVQRQ